MILTLTLNPCIDKTIYLDQLEVGSYNRVKSTREDLAGKGLNVSIVLNNLGEDTLCKGFNFKRTATRLPGTLLWKKGLFGQISSFLTSPAR